MASTRLTINTRLVGGIACTQFQEYDFNSGCRHGSNQPLLFWIAGATSQHHPDIDRYFAGGPGRRLWRAGIANSQHRPNRRDGRAFRNRTQSGPGDFAGAHHYAQRLSTPLARRAP